MQLLLLDIIERALRHRNETELEQSLDDLALTSQCGCTIVWNQFSDQRKNVDPETQPENSSQKY